MTVLTDELLASFDASVAPVEDAVTLPPVVYTSEEFLAFERQALFSREWLCVGRATRIPNPGDFFTARVNGEGVIVARGKDGTVHAFSAVCRHRGMEVATGEGTCTTFTCPYHHWVYALDGRLLGAPAMERTHDFEKKDWGLPNLAVELWKGFVFVNLDAAAAPLAPTLSRYEPFLDHYELDDCVCPGTFTLTDLPWNWKVMFENFNDGYHAEPAPPGDPGLLPEQPGGVPGAVGRRLERGVPHQRLHPHRRRVQRHDEGAPADLPQAHGGGAVAFDLRPRPALALLRHGT